MPEFARQFEMDFIDANGVLRRRVKFIAADRHDAERRLAHEHPKALLTRCTEVAHGQVVPGLKLPEDDAA
ncbi:hypothetical protein [Mucisphaera calidilacus]|uniref:Uncharacterized protein n=1 Tax=Mucisphaera calidilacus TaxID=2527982 RepID=A0A518BTN8_9BACT|nr:hypothetical protein [Mucisphaera calidilacus]QDU70342.1 hypothetical protein Pan265_01680 [Mucisphaera calidilacus]